MLSSPGENALIAKSAINNKANHLIPVIITNKQVKKIKLATVLTTDSFTLTSETGQTTLLCIPIFFAKKRYLDNRTKKID
jgi:hypothetical protein